MRPDPTALRPYARAVHAATDAYVAGLPDAALDPVRGGMPACLLGALLTLAMRRGEIACLARGHRPAVDGTEA